MSPPDSKRRLFLLPPGTYRIPSNVVIEADLTDEQLRDLFQQADAVPLAPEVSPEEEERKRELGERARNLTAAYESQCRDAPNTMAEAMGGWLQEFGEAQIRAAIAETASARIPSTYKRYIFFKDRLREWRFKKLRERT